VKLLIAIPALNEEDSIESIISRCLTARDSIIAGSPVEKVEITVISDGSTDRTVELAQRYTDQVKLLEFPTNRGYGAAIKEAWRQSDAELLGFLDADGTCDPAFFGPLCRALFEQGADVVIGSRMNRHSKMPLIRRLGNLIFALILRVLSSRPVRDTASGMRVVRRSSLRKVFPPPDGLHFTPAMSARALLDRGVRIAEIDMAYHERQGESKLRVWKDGTRFLRVILESAFLYRPSRPLAIVGAIFILAASGLMFMPTVFYLRNRYVAEWMIYRFVVSQLFGIGGVLCFAASFLTSRILQLTLSQAPAAKGLAESVGKAIRGRWFWFWPVIATSIGVAIVIPSLYELVRTGATYEHWSRFIVMSFLLVVSQILVVTWLVNHVLTLLEERVRYLASPDEFAEFPKTKLASHGR